MFNVNEIKVAEEARMVGDTFRSNMFTQGVPQRSPPSTMVMHSWSTRADVKDELHRNFGQIPEDEVHEHLEEADLQSGWLIALHSMKRSFELLQGNSELSYKRRFYPEFTYDRVAFVRLEHHFPAGYLSLYSFNTSEAVFLAFGANDYPSVPTLILMSHESAWKLGTILMYEFSAWRSSNAPPIVDKAGIYSWLQRVTGLPVKGINLVASSATHVN
jgi:hypothetical protein